MIRTGAICITAVSLLFAAATTAHAQQPPDPTAETHKILLWNSGAPGALGAADQDIPTLTLYPPYGVSKIPRTAVIVAPGGGYGWLASNHEGRQEADWLNSLGVTAFVLKYRLGPKYHHPIELGDAQRAIRLVRSRAQEFGIDPNRIGMMGFSAGGHLTSTAGTHFDNGNAGAADPVDRAISRPDFMILVYPAISFTARYTHPGSAKNLLGENPDPQLLKELSSDLQVTPQTPPAFLVSTNQDDVVPAENSVDFYLALRHAGVPAELHVFEKGPHGFGLDFQDPVLGQWPMLLVNWMRSRGLLDAPAH
jgi:acetyl esterase/lipase